MIAIDWQAFTPWSALAGMGLFELSERRRANRSG